jgi:major membrane immunogen (membrane-anchored lipoprotein)
MRFLILFIATLMAISCTNAPKKLNDGVYTGQSYSKYKEEPYVGITEIEIKNNKFVNVSFRILDTTKNELFDSIYERNYPGNQEYILQCRNDWKGVVRYPKEFIKKQSITDVDAVSGATWSYNLFKSSAEIAIKKAQKGRS